MKKIIFALIILSIGFQGCYKEIVYEDNPFLVRTRTLDYQSLTMSNSSLFLGDTLKIEAKASGDSLQFLWSSTGGILTFSKGTAFFTADSSKLYTISCKITDKYGNSMEKSSDVQVSTELIFSGIESMDVIIPVNHTTQFTAMVSGEGLTYNWSASGGTMMFDNHIALFYAQDTGIYNLNCLVTDKYGVSETRVISIEVAESFIYKSLTATQLQIDAGQYTEITADVLGADLTYTWKSNPPGSIVGEGNIVLFTICHADTFEVSCQVTDRFGNSEIKSVSIKVIL
jgi:hypothetical protein